MARISKKSAQDIIDRYVVIAGGAGAVPLPLIDIAGVIAIQIKMMRELAKIYAVNEEPKFSYRSLALSLMGSAGTTFIAGAATSLLKLVPGINVLVGATAGPLLMGATTYAMGHVFAEHLECGGNLNDFDVSHAKKVFRTYLKQGKEATQRIRERNSPPPVIEESKQANKPEEDFKIYLIQKPNLGKNGKAYLKTYINGKRPEKYIGTLKSLQERYETVDLESFRQQIIDDHEETLIQHLIEKGFVGDEPKDVVTLEAK